jgi:ABC-2 family transporter protein
MTPPAALFAIRWLVRDTFRQALATGIFWLMLAVTVLCVVACLSVRIVDGATLGGRGPTPPLSDHDRFDLTWVAGDLLTGTAARSRGTWQVPVVIRVPDPLEVRPWSRLELANGLVHFDVLGDRAQAVRALQVYLAGWVADAGGLLLALLWTAGLLPSFLEPASVTVLLAKPVPRWSLLVGKCLGVLAFVAFQALVFLTGTWLALGVRTGLWDGRYFVCLPLLLLHFSVFFSFSAMLAVATRNTVACVFGSVLFWLLCLAMNFGRHAVRSYPELNRMSAGAGWAVEAGYWLLPKPLDFHVILLDALHADASFGRLVNVQTLTDAGLWSPALSVSASLLSAAALLAVAAYDFLTAEY